MHRYIRLTFLYMAVFLLILMSTKDFKIVEASEKTAQTLLTVECGTGGVIRCGRMLGVKVTVDSDGLLTGGTLSVTVLSSSSDQVAYSQFVDFAQNDSVKTEFVISLNEEITGLLVVMSDENKHIVAKKKIPIETVNYGEYPVVGLLSESPDDLIYLKQFGFKTASLGKDAIPQNYLGLDAFDAVVVDNFALETLSPVQLTALKEWTAHGGTLILSGNRKDLDNITLLAQHHLFELSEEVDYRPVFHNISVPVYSTEEEEVMDNDMNNYQKERLSMIQSIKENADHNSFSHSYIGETMEYEETKHCIINHRDLYQYSVANSNKIKEWKNCTWLETVSYQKGVVELFHFQLAKDSEGVTRGQTAIAHLMISFLSNTNEARRWEEEMGYYNTFPIYDTQTLNTFPNNKMPAILLIFLVYLSIIGPGSYLFLKKKRCSSMLWIVVPTVAVIFTGILVLIGKSTYLTKPYVKALAMKHYAKDGTIYGTVYSSVTFPQSQSDSLTLCHADAIYYGGYSYPPYFSGILDPVGTDKISARDVTFDVNITSAEEQLKLQLKRHPVFTEKKMVVTYTEVGSKEVESNGKVTYTGYSLTGNVRNPSTQKLSHSFLYYQGYYVDTGTLFPGDTLCIDGKNAAYYPCFNNAIANSSDNFISMMFIDPAEQTPYNRTILQGIAQLIDSKKLNRDSAYLIGFSDEGESVLPFGEIENNTESCLDTIAYAEIPVTTTLEHTVKVPDLLDFAINPESFRTDYYSQFSYNGNIDAILRLPCGMRPKKIGVSDMFCNEEQSGSRGREFEKIYFYNWDQKRYDLFFYLKPGHRVMQYQSEELSAYYKEDGIMKVKYEGANSANGIYQIPVISCSLEKIDAGD